MSDKIRIIGGLLADFSTAEWGILKVIDGKVTLDETKAFNRARRYLNSGANTFRMLRRGVWSIQKEFDWESPGYWELLKEYLVILHQPVQGTPKGTGSDIVIELFDGCSESWFYDKANWGMARTLIERMFAKVGDVPYVKFGVGNELNKKAAVDFHKNLVYKVFAEHGRIPFSYGTSYTEDTLDWMIDEKQEASIRWGDEVSYSIYKQVHGICDVNSNALGLTATYWVNHPLCTIWSMDGVKNGASKCDYYQDDKVKHTRPSRAQWQSAVHYVLDRAKRFVLESGQPKFGFEAITKAVNNDECATQNVLAMADEYLVQFGKRPENYGKYPNDWVEPEPPPIPPEPEPEPEPPPEPDESLWEKIWEWIKGLFD